MRTTPTHCKLCGKSLGMFDTDLCFECFLKERKREMKDNTNPDYYRNQTSLECIDSMLMIFGQQRVYDFCICNAWKYIWRWKNKNGIEDLNKAKWYIGEAINVLQVNDVECDCILDRMSAYIETILEAEETE